MDERFGRNGGPTCKTLNHWPNAAGDPMPDPLTDPRYVTIFVTDEQAFGGSGNDIYPVRRFAGFYLTSADGLNCPGDVHGNPRRQEHVGALGVVRRRGLRRDTRHHALLVQGGDVCPSWSSNRAAAADPFEAHRPRPSRTSTFG